jgi:hypothetical protein
MRGILAVDRARTIHSVVTVEAQNRSKMKGEHEEGR